MLVHIVQSKVFIDEPGRSKVKIDRKLSLPVINYTLKYGLKSKNNCDSTTSDSNCYSLIYIHTVYFILSSPSYEHPGKKGGARSLERNRGPSSKLTKTSKKVMKFSMF